MSTAVEDPYVLKVRREISDLDIRWWRSSTSG